MKKMIIRAIGILLIVLGAARAFACLRVVFVFVPVLFGHDCLISAGTQAALLNLGMASVALAKVAGGVGLLWLKTWAKWVAAVAAIIHVLFLSYFGLPIWFQMAKGTFENPAGIPMWKDFVTIGLNLAVAVTVLACMKKSKETRGTTPSSILFQARA